MQFHPQECRGFTLIELIASITIVAILAAVTLPRMTTAQPFAERGYADGVAASLRQSRAVALASGCDVRFTINAAGYSAMQRAAAGTHCAAAGAWTTPVQRGDGRALSEIQPPVHVANRVIVFTTAGNIVGGPFDINVGAHLITVDASGAVQGP